MQMSNLAVQLQPERELYLDSFVPCRLSNLSQSVGKSIATICGKRFGLTMPEWRVLVTLGRYRDLSAVEVAERTLLDKVAVSRAVNKLVKNGCIDRQFADVDRRRSILNLSTEGRRLLDDTVPMALDFEDDLLSELTDAEIAVFNKVMDKLHVKARKAT